LTRGTLPGLGHGTKGPGQQPCPAGGRRPHPSDGHAALPGVRQQQSYHHNKTRDSAATQVPNRRVSIRAGALPSYPWQTLVAGHNGRLGTRADAELQIAYVADLLASAQATMASLNPAPLFQKYGNNTWAIIKAYFNEASAQTAAPVTKKYLGKLAAADVFTFDNAYTVFEFALREDGGVLGPFGIHP